MDSEEEVLVVGVETSTECLYLGRRKKGKSAANLRKRKKFSKGCAEKRCLVVVDSDGESEDGCVEVHCEDKHGMLPVISSSSTDDKDDLDCVELSNSSGVDSHGYLVDSDCSRRQDGNLNLLHVDLLLDKTTSNPSTSVPPFRSKEVYASDSDHLESVKKTSVPPFRSKEVYASDSDLLEPVKKDDTEVPSLCQSDFAASNCKSRSQTKSVADTNKKEDTVSSSSSSSEPHNSGARRERVPTCWTNCPNCPPNKKRKYHLIDVAYNSAEWSVVSNPLTQSGGFSVNRVQRIQNESLWQRLCYEKQLMLREQPDVNEQFLYHTTRSSVSVICEEGLDLRLSRNGYFGHGIYFRYWWGLFWGLRHLDYVNLIKGIAMFLFMLCRCHTILRAD